MQISILTLFPEIIEPFLSSSIVKLASQKKQVHFRLINWRKYTSDKHHTVDDHPYGGGAGMLLMVQPIVEALEALEKKYGPGQKVLLSPQGTLWNQKQAAKTVEELHPSGHLILICGRYEGFDERILKYVDKQISIGRYILSGGESAALVLIDSLVRLIPGVLKKEEATSEETFMTISKHKLYQISKDKKVLSQKEEQISLLEYPQYTKPENFRGQKVPSVLLSGNHQQIYSWRIKKSWAKTKKQK